MTDPVHPSSWTMSLTATWGLPIALLVGSLSWVVYTLFLHPLSRFPGPRLAALTRLWYVGQLQKGGFPKRSRRLHEIYGPVVRIAPNEISFGDPKAGLTIYNVKTKFSKTDFYSAWGLKNFDTDEEKSFPDVDEIHAGNRRRLLLPTYSMTSVTEGEKYIDRYTKLLLKRFGEMAEKKQAFNLVGWMAMYAADVVGELFYGCSFNHLESGRDLHGWIAATENFTRFMTVHGSLAPALRLLHGMWQHFTNKDFRSTLDATEVFRKTSVERVEARVQEMAMGKKGGERKDLLAKFMALVEEKQRGDFQAPDVMQEGFTALFAGSDTTAIAIASTLHGLMTHTRATSKLLVELRDALDTGRITRPVRYADSIKLPYMSACIKEGFRMHASVGLTMPRFVPPGGCEIFGEYFPAGTRVGLNAHVTHFDKDVFGEDADEFQPERWLRGNAADMDKYMLHFGAGTRTCIGKNIALAEIHKLLPHLLLEFDLQLVDLDAPIVSNGQWFDKPTNMIVTAHPRRPSKGVL